MLDGFLPPFNTHFRVQAAQPESAYCPLDPDAVLAFRHPRTVARDNTVKYRWRTLQLLPSPEQTSFAGARVDVVERPDGDLAVQPLGFELRRETHPPARRMPPKRHSPDGSGHLFEAPAIGLGDVKPDKGFALTEN